MKTSRERVLELLARGVIDAAEAERLLASIDPGEVSSPGGALVNPFLRLGPIAALACGVVSSVLGLAWATMGIRYDGFLDLHVGSAPVALRVALVDQLAGWPLAGLVCWLACRFIARARARLVELAGGLGLARLPTALVGPLALLLDPASPIGSARSAGVMATLLLALALQLVWSYQGMRHAAGRATPGTPLAFAVTVVLAEVLGKLIVATR